MATPGVITTAARLLAAEAEHAGSIHTQVARLGIPSSAVDGADLIPRVRGNTNQFLSINLDNGLAATRTAGQVLYLALGMKADATQGGFFPTGLNGKIAVSTGPATEANLNYTTPIVFGIQPFDVHNKDLERSVKLAKLLFCLACIAPANLIARGVKVTPPLLSRDITEFPGKEGVMITVEYAPSVSEPIHRHNAYVFVYVIEGSVVMQVKGGKEMTLNAGQTFYEAPTDVHVIVRNASKTKPAKFVAFLVRDKGAPVHIPVK